jgi:hypothetical protein
MTALKSILTAALAFGILATPVAASAYGWHHHHHWHHWHHHWH